MTKRGNILREPGDTPGLLMIEGQQFRFSLDGVWKSDVPPKSGMVVNVDLDQSSQVQAITVIPESQLAREQAEAAMSKAKEKGGQLFNQLVAKVGMPDLAAGVLLFLGWWVLATISIQIPLLGKLSFTFWQLLGFLNANNVLEAMDHSMHPSAGMYGFIAVLAFIGPYLHHVWKDRRAVLGGVAPLLFMLVVWFMAHSSFQSITGTTDTSGAFADMQKQMQTEAMNAISFGLGAYASILASLYFAGIAVKKFLLSAPTAVEAVKSKRAAA